MSNITNDLFSFFYETIPQEGSTLLPKEFSNDLQKSCSTIVSEAGESEDSRRDVIVELYSTFKALERALISGECFVLPAGVHRREPLSCYPRLFGDLYSSLLLPDGRVRPLIRLLGLEFDLASCIEPMKPVAFSFWLLRQLSLAFSKASDVPSRTSTESQTNAFIDRMVRDWEFPITVNNTFFSDVLCVARELLKTVFSDDMGRILPQLVQWEADPYGRHGPGSVADGSKGAGKWDYQENDRTNDLFVSTGLSGSEALFSRYVNEGSALPPSLMTFVPKDPIKDRVICMEPKELQFAQQGLLDLIVDIIGSSPLTKKMIHLKDQSVNYCMSRDYNYSTIDLSDASDLLSLRLMRVLLPKEVFSLFTRYRSQQILLENGELLTSYNAFATMGNALCFPFESLAFWALSLAAIFSNELRIGSYQSVSEICWVIRNNPKHLLRRRRIYVFGDDIIVPRVHFDAVTSVLEAAGLVVNHSKSCNDTLIRESCGSYWFAGMDTRVTRFSYASCADLLSGASLIDQIRELGEFFPKTASALLRAVSISLGQNPDYSSRVSIPEGIRAGWLRWNAEYQRVEKRVPLLLAAETRKLPGEIGLYAYWTQQATKSPHLANAQRVEWCWVPYLS